MGPIQTPIQWTLWGRLPWKWSGLYVKLTRWSQSIAEVKNEWSCTYTPHMPSRSRNYQFAFYKVEIQHRASRIDIFLIKSFSFPWTLHEDTQSLEVRRSIHSYNRHLKYVSFRFRLIYPLGKKTRYSLNRRMGKPQSWSGRFRTERNLYFLSEIEPHFPGIPPQSTHTCHTLIYWEDIIEINM